MPRLSLTTLTSRLGALALPTLLALTPACGGDDASWGEDASYDSAGGAGVGQGGAQDFGQFKQILEDGEIPGPETIDDSIAQGQAAAMAALSAAGIALRAAGWELAAS